MVGRLRAGSEQIRRIERNGVPIYHVVDDGPARAALIFRVGRGDEEASTAGVTHLVEHLALFPFGQQPYQYNGMVDAVATVFVATGKPGEVAEHLTTLSGHLAALPIDRLETEQRVLRDEAGRRSVGPPDHHGWLRWGLHGPGLAFVPEFGLWRLVGTDIQAWAARWFTAGNAALVWAGPKLPPFDLLLPPGERQAPAALTTLVSGPVWAVGAPDHVTISFTQQRDTPGAAAQRILAKRLQQKLRYERGLSYDVSMQYQPLSAEVATSTMWASCAGKDAESVRDVVLEATQQLAADGPTVDELAADLDGMQRAREQPFTAQGEANRLAIQELLGAPPESLAELEAELEKVTPETAREAFRLANRTAIVTQPTGLPAPADWLAAYPNLATEVFAGKAHRNRGDSALPFLRRLPSLVVGDVGVSLVARDGTGFGIRYADVAVAVQHSTGTLAVLHENGSEIDVDPAWWVGAQEATTRIKAALAPERVVQVEDPPGTSTGGPGRLSDGTRRFWLAVVVTLFVLTAWRLINAESRRPTLGGGATLPPLAYASAFGPISVEAGGVSFAKEELDCGDVAANLLFLTGNQVWWSATFGTAERIGRLVRWSLTLNGVQVGSGDVEIKPAGPDTECAVGGPLEVARDVRGTYRLELWTVPVRTLLADGAFIVPG